MNNKIISNIVADRIKESIEIKEKILNNLSDIISAAKLIVKCLKQGNKIILFGNGGSAADAQHIAGELVGRFKKERKALAAISLATDTSVLTCLGNDYGFKYIFSRQIQALAKKGDVIIALSTSGKSPNILQAISEAKKMGCKIIALTGEKGTPSDVQIDVCIKIPSQNTPRIQEAHITIGHIWCEIVEEQIF